MKIGVLTFHYNQNFGAVLQAYALAKFIKSSGADVELIDYRPPYFSFRKIIFRRIRGFFFPNLPILLAAQRHISFFNKQSMLSKKTFWWHQSSMFTPYNIVISGSDEIWKISKFRGNDLTFFLPFKKGEKQFKLAYSASTSATSDKHFSSEIVGYIKDYDHISVRDSFSAKYIEEVTGKKPLITCDPSLLISYDELIRDELTQTNKAYALAYIQGNSKKLDSLFKGYSEKSSINVVNFELQTTFQMNLTVFKNAKHIFTNTYHGIMLSIIFNKPFTYIAMNVKKPKCNDFLSRYNLNDHAWHNDIPTHEQLYTLPPNKESLSRLNKDIEMSKKYLLNTLFT